MVTYRALAVAAMFGLSLLALGSGPAMADVEPNDDFANAEPIAPGTYAGDLAVNPPADTDDYYAVTLTADGQTLYANASVGVGGPDIIVHIYDAALQERCSDMIIAPGTGRCLYTFGAPQTAYVRVERWGGGTGSYTLQVAVMDQNDAGGGGDAGNAFGSATAIAPGSYPGNWLGGADADDYYAVTLTTTGQTVYANITTATLEANLYLYDGSLTEVCWDWVTPPGAARCLYTFGAPQTAYVRVDRGTYRFDTYDLEVAVVDQNDVGSGGDAGGIFASATPVTPGTYSGNLLRGQDGEDYYSVTLAAGTTLYVNVTFPDGTTDATLYVYDGSQAEVCSSSQLPPATERCVYNFGVAQTAYIRVERTWSGGPYDLELFLASVPADLTPPTVTNLRPPDTTTSDNTPLIAADYSDASGIDTTSVVLQVDGLDVTSLATVTATGVSYTPAAAQADGAHVVWLSVEDALGNPRTVTWGYIVAAADTAPPTLTHTPVASALVGQAIAISATVTDNLAVSTVFVNYTRVTGVTSNVTMARSGDVYSFTVPGQATAGTVRYFIWANDTSDNVARTAVFTVTVSDISPPVIVHTAVTSAYAGDAITITTTITDNVAVQSATLFYRKQGDAAYTTVTMTSSGSSYSAPIPSAAVTTAGVQYYISATDGTNPATSPAANPASSPYEIPVTERATPSEFPWLLVIFVLVIIVVVAVVGLLLMKARKARAKPPVAGTPPSG